MKSSLLALILTLALAGSLTTTPAEAAGMSGMSGTQMNTEERFQDLFLTAGYCTAFGAALGTAMLAFTTNPTENLRFVAVGASLGFIGGSALGSYIILSPLLADGGPSSFRDSYTGSLASEGRMPSRGLVIRPTIDRNSHKLMSIEGGLTLARF